MHRCTWTWPGLRNRRSTRHTCCQRGGRGYRKWICRCRGCIDEQQTHQVLTKWEELHPVKRFNNVCNKCFDYVVKRRQKKKLNIKQDHVGESDDDDLNTCALELDDSGGKRRRHGCARGTGDTTFCTKVQCRMCNKKTSIIQHHPFEQVVKKTLQSPTLYKSQHDTVVKRSRKNSRRRLSRAGALIKSKIKREYSAQWGKWFVVVAGIPHFTPQTWLQRVCPYRFF